MVNNMTSEMQILESFRKGICEGDDTALLALADALEEADDELGLLIRETVELKQDFSYLSVNPLSQRIAVYNEKHKYREVEIGREVALSRRLGPFFLKLRISPNKLISHPKFLEQQPIRLINFCHQRGFNNDYAKILKAPELDKIWHIHLSIGNLGQLEAFQTSIRKQKKFSLKSLKSMAVVIMHLFDASHLIDGQHRIAMMRQMAEDSINELREKLPNTCELIIK